MSWEELRDAVVEDPTVILPIGAVEEHGSHNPLGEELFLVEKVARMLGERTRTIVAPVIPIGDSFLLMPFPGTLYVKPETLAEYVFEVCESMIAHGVKRIVFFSPHLGNKGPVDSVAGELRKKGILCAQIDWWRLGYAIALDVTETKDFPDGHGSEFTTSVMLAIRPDLVDLRKAPKTRPKESLHTKYRGYMQRGGIITYPYYNQLTDTGVIGDPTLATKEKGDRIIEKTLTYLEEFVTDFKKEPLPPKFPQLDI